MAEPRPSTLLADRMSDWWRPFTVDLDGQLLARRRQGIEALRQALSRENVVDAVAYAHGDDEAGRRIIAMVCRAAQTADAEYRGEVGDAEPPALVAAALADRLAVDPDGELSTLISLLVLNAGYSGKAPAIVGMRLPEYAVRQLEYRSVSMRRTGEPHRRSASELIGDAVRDAPRSAGAGSEGDEAAGMLGSAAQLEVLSALAARIDEVAADVASGQEVMQEQLRQQTWVRQSWCTTARAPWRDVEPAARPVIAALELAERTRGVTPAIDAQALLGSVLTDASPGLGVDPVVAIAVGGPYTEDRLRVVPHPTLFPVAAALARWRTQGPDAQFSMRDTPGLDVGWQDEVAIALQVYRELLALRGLGHE